MIARVIALLLAVIMTVGATAQVCASPGAPTSVIDDAPDVALPVAPAPVVVVAAERPVQAQVVQLPDRVFGRIHAVVIFRPPR